MIKKTKKWGVETTDATINEVRSQIQEDLIIFLEDIDKNLGNKDEYVLNECLKIIIDNFNTLRSYDKYGI